MLEFIKKEDLRNHLEILHRNGQKVGFVPTMGALHQGHISLIEKSKSQTEATLASIFVNPTQFNDKTDFDNYSVTIDADRKKLNDARCDILFLPSVGEIYPNGVHESFNISFGNLENKLEGAYRPDHFKGVGNVVKRLLEIVEPDVLYLGQKDYQQYLVIKSLIAQLSMNIEIELCPVIREADGLAMSSRNVRLTPVERKIAATLSQILFELKDQAFKKPMKELRQWAHDSINETPGMSVQYFEFADRDDLTILDDWNDSNRIIVVAVVLVGNVRLLDNIIIC